MTFATIIIIALALFEAVAWLALLGKEGELEERELALDKQEASLQIREERNKEDFISLAQTEAEMTEVHSTYVVTEADEMKYNTDRAIYNVARNRIAHNIAYDIIHRFDPIWDGKKMEYRFKVKEEE